MDKDRYKGIKEHVSGEFREKGSRFIAHAFPLGDETVIKSIISELRKNHPKANHVCFAYIIVENGLKSHFSDDREPSGSAGKPIMGALNSMQLSNVLVAVVRYFGGTKLGIPGLIKAYREAAINALNKADIIEFIIHRSITIVCAHRDINEVFRIANNLQGIVEIMDSKNTGITISLKVPAASIKELLIQLNSTYPLNENLKILKN